MGYITGFITLVFISGAVYAGQITDDLLGIPAKLVFVAACVALAGGIASTLQRLNNNSQLPIADRKISNLYLDIVTGLVTSLSAGMLMFALVEGTSLKAMYQGALIFLAGWGGSKTLDDAFQKYVLRKQ
jgi:biotin transporter BioY